MDEPERQARRRLRLMRLMTLELFICTCALAVLALSALWAVLLLETKLPELEALLSGLQSAVRSLDGLDTQALSETISQAAEDAKQSLTLAGKALSEFDFDGLDTAVETLNTIMEPLSELVEKLR